MSRCIFFSSSSSLKKKDGKLKLKQLNASRFLVPSCEVVVMRYGWKCVTLETSIRQMDGETINFWSLWRRKLTEKNIVKLILCDVEDQTIKLGRQLTCENIKIQSIKRSIIKFSRNRKPSTKDRQKVITKQTQPGADWKWREKHKTNLIKFYCVSRSLCWEFENS